MPTVLTLRLTPQKLAKIDRRAAQAGRDRSAYVRSLIDQDLEAERKSKYVFASSDLAGSVHTGGIGGDNATVRRMAKQHLTRAKNR